MFVLIIKAITCLKIKLSTSLYSRKPKFLLIKRWEYTPVFCSRLISFLSTKRAEKKFYLCFNIHLFPTSGFHLLIIIGINFTYKQRNFND